MTKHNVDELVKSICAEFKVIVVVDEDFPQNYGECYPDLDKIVLSKQYSSGNLKLAVFLHELGHILTMRRKGSRYLAASVFQEESAVWSLAQELHLKYTNRPFTKAQGQFMLQCLNTYSEHHYSFVKKYNKPVENS